MVSVTTRRFFGLLMAGLLAAVSGVAGVSSAQGQPMIDPSVPGSITVHSDMSGSMSVAHVSGCGFTVTRIPSVALHTVEGQRAAVVLSRVFDPRDPVGSIVGAGHTVGTPSVVGRPASGGVIVFDQLPVGLYVVQEVGCGVGVIPSVPSIVSVPLTDPKDRDVWVYDVHIYPKRSVVSVSKTVDDGAAVVMGDTITFTVTADIPVVSVVDAFQVVDPLDSRFDYVSTSVVLQDGTPIKAGTDCTVDFNVSLNTVTVDFTAAGLDVLSRHNTSRVVVTIRVKTNTTGEVPNQARVFPNRASFPTGTIPGGTPAVSEEVHTSWGGITIQKVEEGHTLTRPKPLTGAQFQIFTSLTDATNRVNPVALDTDGDGARERTFTVTAPDGTLTLTGLRYSATANGHDGLTANDPGFIHYYLVETQAPAGHERLTDPIPFTITTSTTQPGVDLIITNIPTPSNTIHTGGGLFTTPNTWWIIIATLLTLTGTTTIIIMRARQRNHSNH